MMGRSGLLFVGGSFVLMLLGLDYLIFEKMLMVEYIFGKLGGVELGVKIMLDWVSLLFYSVVLMISGLIMIYSSDYMEGELNKDRFVY